METLKSFLLLQDYNTPGILIKKGTIIHPTLDNDGPFYMLGETHLFLGQMLSNKQWFLEYVGDDCQEDRPKGIRMYEVKCEHGYQLMIYCRKYDKHEFDVVVDVVTTALERNYRL